VAPFDAIDLYIVITLVNPCPSNLKGGFLSQVIVIYFDPPDPNGISAFIVFHCYSPKSIQKVEGLKRKTDINRGWLLKEYFPIAIVEVYQGITLRGPAILAPDPNGRGTRLAPNEFAPLGGAQGGYLVVVMGGGGHSGSPSLI